MRQCDIESKEIICRQTYRLQFIKIFFITVRQYLMTLFLIAVILFVVLLYVPSQQLWSLRDGQFT